MKLAIFPYVKILDEGRICYSFKKMGNARFDRDAAEDCVLLGYESVPLGHRIVTLRWNVVHPPPILKGRHVLVSGTFRRLNIGHAVC